MVHNCKTNSNKITLAIHSTDNYFGFGSRENKSDISDNFFVKKFEKDLCNNLIFDFQQFMNKNNFKKVDTISVSTGPANFNASRLIVVLARTISQQLDCTLHGFSSFELMAKRIALKNNIYKNRQSFWIYKKLKRRGYIAGKYEVYASENIKKDLFVKEKIIPKIFEKLGNKDPNFPAEYNEKEDLKELLNLSNKNLQISNYDSWKKVLPIYPISPIN